MKTMIVPLTKSPLPQKGRIGKRELQDWYRGLVEAVRIEQFDKDSVIYVISDVHITGAPHEADLYSGILQTLGAKRIEVIRSAFETIGQLEITFDIARREKCRVVIISSLFHFPRVWWLSRKENNVQHDIVFGLPRLKECITDIFLSFIFPILDLLGKRNYFKKYVEERRTAGIQ